MISGCFGGRSREKVSPFCCFLCSLGECLCRRRWLGAERRSGVAPVFSKILDGAEPGALTVAGITAYGVIDFNLAWQTHGVPTSPSYYQGMEYQIAKNSQGPQFAFTNNALQVSTVGLRGNESLSEVTGYSPLGGWSVIFDLQIGFNPAFGEIADDLKALRQNNGVPLATADGESRQQPRRSDFQWRRIWRLQERCLGRAADMVATARSCGMRSLHTIPRSSPIRIRC